MKTAYQNRKHDRPTVRYGALALAAGFSLLTGGCAALTGETATKLDTFELSTPSGANASPVRSGVQILIAEPTALKAVDSENIIIQTSPLSIQYLGESQWSDRLPKLVQSKLADAFQNSGQFGGVGLPGQGLAIDYQVITEIREFGVDAARGQARVVISSKLLNDRNGVVVSSDIFEGTAAVTTGDNANYVRGLDAAFNAVADEMVAWVTGRI